MVELWKISPPNKEQFRARAEPAPTASECLHIKCIWCVFTRGKPISFIKCSCFQLKIKFKLTNRKRCIFECSLVFRKPVQCCDTTEPKSPVKEGSPSQIIGILKEMGAVQNGLTLPSSLSCSWHSLCALRKRLAMSIKPLHQVCSLSLTSRLLGWIWE